jgi:hypothetical protein
MTTTPIDRMPLHSVDPERATIAQVLQAYYNRIEYLYEHRGEPPGQPDQ